jgi:hypothetical protein
VAAIALSTWFGVAHAQSSVVVKPSWRVFTVGDVAGASANLVNGIACNAAAGSRTVTLQLDGRFGRVRLPIWLTYNAATALTVTPECSLDGTTYANYLTRSCTSGVCTASTFVDTLSTGAASIDGTFEYDVSGCTKFRVVVACTGGGASDTLIVQAMGQY